MLKDPKKSSKKTSKSSQSKKDKQKSPKTPPSPDNLVDQDNDQILPDDAFANDDEFEFGSETYDSNFLIGPGDMILSNDFLEETNSGFFSKNPEMFLSSSGSVVRKNETNQQQVQYRNTYHEHLWHPDFNADYEMANQLAASDAVYDADMKLAQQFAIYHYVDSVESLQREIRSEKLQDLYSELSLSRSLSNSKKNICRSEDSMTESTFKPIHLDIFSIIMSFLNLKKIAQIRTVNKFFKGHCEKILFSGELYIANASELYEMYPPSNPYYMITNHEQNMMITPEQKVHGVGVKKHKIPMVSELVMEILNKTHTIIYTPMTANLMKIGTFGFASLQKIILMAQYKYEVDSLVIQPHSNPAYYPVGKPKGMQYIIYVCHYKKHCQVCQFDEIYQCFANHFFSFPNVTLYHNGKLRLGWE